jgi:radical SAM protein with 4Fe4S-binding SPASM domain
VTELSRTIYRFRTFAHKGFNEFFRQLNVSTVPVAPTHAFVEVTQRCNVLCRTCPRNLRRSPSVDRDMLPEVYEKVKKQVLQHVKKVDLTSLGEPLCHPHISTILEDCFRLGTRVIMNTNATLLGDALIESLVKHNVEVAISVDGATEETFEYIRPQVKWENIQRVMEKIRTERNRVRNSPFSLTVNFVVMRRNFLELPALIKWCEGYGVDKINVLNFGVAGRTDEFAREALAFHLPFLAENLAPILASIRSSRIDIRAPDFYAMLAVAQKGDEKNQAETTSRKTDGRTARKKYFQRCVMPWRSTYVDVDGNVYPCCIGQSYPIGNILREDFRRLWNNKPYRLLRRTIHSGSPPGFCRSCNLPPGITGGNENYFN